MSAHLDRTGDDGRWRYDEPCRSSPSDSIDCLNPILADGISSWGSRTSNRELSRLYQLICSLFSFLVSLRSQTDTVNEVVELRQGVWVLPNCSSIVFDRLPSSSNADVSSQSSLLATKLSTRLRLFACEERARARLPLSVSWPVDIA